MKVSHRFLAFLLGANVLCCLASVASAADTPEQRVSPYLEPPLSFAETRNALRSPLLFEDGKRALNAADWQKRREEIKAAWEAALGKWPEVLARPRVEILREEDHAAYTQKRVRVEIARDRFEEGWLLVPKRQGPRPGVFVPYYEPETSCGLTNQEYRDYAKRLAERGFVALAIGSPGGNARKPEPGREGWQPLSFLAYVSANCARVLGQLPEVDPARLGVVGHSYGGKWAMFSACLNEAFACAAWSDPGIGFDDTRESINYWEPWYLGSVPGTQRMPGLPTQENPARGPYAELRKQGRDLQEFQALMAPRPFFVSGGSEDPPERWALLNHVRDVYSLLGVPRRVGLHNRPAHAPTREATDLLCDFLEHFLRP